MLGEIRARGVPEHLRALLETSKKGEAERLAKEMVITGDELMALIINCDQIGYSHSRKHVQFVPEHLKRTEAETDAYFGSKPGPLKGKARKAFQKIVTTFKERRVINVHLFQSDDEWHCFYFSPDDALESPAGQPNHWKGGTHIHYVSHCWGIPLERVATAFDERNTSLKNVHIRYEHDGAPSERDGSREGNKDSDEG